MLADEIVVQAFHELSRRLRAQGVRVWVVAGIEGRHLKGGYHPSGFALDVAVSPDTNAAWDAMGTTAEAIGFRWGKRFSRPRPERWHLDAGRYLTPAQARAWYGHGEFLREV